MSNLFHFEEDKPNFESLAKQNGFTFWYATTLEAAVKDFREAQFLGTRSAAIGV